MDPRQKQKAKYTARHFMGVVSDKTAVGLAKLKGYEFQVQGNVCSRLPLSSINPRFDVRCVTLWYTARHRSSVPFNRYCSLSRVHGGASVLPP
jgi:hypothetical protein